MNFLNVHISNGGQLKDVNGFVEDPLRWKLKRKENKERACALIKSLINLVQQKIK